MSFGISSRGRETRKPVRVLASATRKALDGHGRRHASGSRPAPFAHGFALGFGGGPPGGAGAGEEEEEQAASESTAKRAARG
jgi:hypothetical protein